jgi:hypothetical protein
VRGEGADRGVTLLFDAGPEAYTFDWSVRGAAPALIAPKAECAIQGVQAAVAARYVR